MFSARRAAVLAVLAFLLALVPGTSSARAQLVRWLYLEGDPASTPEINVLLVQGTRTARIVNITPLARSTIASLRFVGPSGEVSLLEKAQDRQPRLLAPLPIAQLNAAPGWVALDIRPTESELGADRWRSFLAAEALLDVLRPGSDDKPVRVRAFAFYKLLVHRGSAAPGDAITRPVGQPLEIVPLVDPTHLGGNLLPVQLLFRGKPLANARIYAACSDAPTSSTATTDAEGKATLTLSSVGLWVLFATRVMATGESGSSYESFGSRVTIRRR